MSQNTKIEIEPFALDQIGKSYERAVKSSPHFCDMLYWMGRDARADESIARIRRDATDRARRELARHVSSGSCTSLNVLDKELNEMWDEMVYALIQEKRCTPDPEDNEEVRHAKDVSRMEAWARVCDKAFDSIAVLLRIVDVIRGRQALGR